MILLLEGNCDGFWTWAWALILAFLLGLLLGWLLKSIFGKNNDSCERCEGLQAELNSCRSNAKILTENNKTISASLTNALIARKEAVKPKAKKTTPKKTVKKKPKKAVNKKATTKKTTKKVAAVKKESKKDDLTKIEGIGPKIQEHFNNGGIWTWEELANAKISRLQEILNNAGPRYKMHNPGSWPKQATMATKGEWDKLKKWQDDHKGGRE